MSSSRSFMISFAQICRIKAKIRSMKSIIKSKERASKFLRDIFLKFNSTVSFEDIASKIDSLLDLD